ncbi:hypothetical protein ANN_15363 [Periplaneta americana]|uniref:Uncharacterized protein n=1 Tax=Periplaneta americana TaxID=6978 RepID=A0ABQ8SG76_PERAM|nr:hypothetical protein ANN_15363 [Periplaneta americana]
MDVYVLFIIAAITALQIAPNHTFDFRRIIKQRSLRALAEKKSADVTPPQDHVTRVAFTVQCAVWPRRSVVKTLIKRRFNYVHPMKNVFENNIQRLMLVDIMPHGTTINSDAYVATLKKLQAGLSRVRRHREKQDVLLFHDNAQPYVSHKTTDQIRKFG